MKKLAICIVAVVGLIGKPVLAADLNKPLYKAPPPPLPPAPIYTWTGWYVGGNVGYGWGDAHTDLDNNGAVNSVIFASNPSGFPFPLQFADSDTAKLNGAIGGAQVGYNYQINSRWVVGLETDFQASGQRGSGTFTEPFSSGACQIFQPSPLACLSNGPVQGTAATGYEAKIDWFGTLRGRVGFLVGDQVMVYGTGGLAYGRVETSSTTAFSGLTTQFITLPLGAPFAFNGSAFNASRTNVGFSAGAGIEGRLGFLPANWTWKLEYLYVDLGSLDATSSFNAGIPPTFPTFTTATASGTTTLHTHFTDNIVRVGLNYQFH
jgi:outer membrane immunogenic protein